MGRWPLILLLPLVTACAGSPVHRVAPEPTPIPWLDTAPGPVRVPTPPPARPVPGGTAPCRTTDLMVSFSNFNGAGGQDQAGFTFTNRSSAACVLDGRPGGKLLDGSGAEVGGPPRAWTNSGSPAGPVMVEPGASAQLVIAWSHLYPVSCTAGPPVAPAAVVFSIGDASKEVRVAIPPGRTMEPCSGWMMAPFESPTPPAAGAWPPAFDHLRSTLRGPVRIGAGAVLAYQVDLENGGSEAVPIGEWCPDFVQVLMDAAGKVVAKDPHRLNCPVSIGPGQSTSFEMRLGVPASAAPGRYTLRWSMGPPPETTVQSSMAVDIA